MRRCAGVLMTLVLVGNPTGGRVARVVEKHGPSPSGVSTLRDLPRRSVRQVFPSIHPTELYGSAS
jgi:hypothetical protein